MKWGWNHSRVWPLPGLICIDVYVIECVIWQDSICFIWLQVTCMKYAIYTDRNITSMINVGQSFGRWTWAIFDFRVWNQAWVTLGLMLCSASPSLWKDQKLEPESTLFCITYVYFTTLHFIMLLLRSKVQAAWPNLILTDRIFWSTCILYFQ